LAKAGTEIRKRKKRAFGQVKIRLGKPAATESLEPGWGSAEKKKNIKKQKRTKANMKLT